MDAQKPTRRQRLVLDTESRRNRHSAVQQSAQGISNEEDFLITTEYMSTAYSSLSDQHRGLSPGKHQAPNISSKLLLCPGPKVGEKQPVIGLQGHRDCRCHHPRS